MCAAIVIADGVTAAGFRLTGVETLAPDDNATAQAFADAWRRADLVVMSTDRARLLPPGLLDSARASSHPVLALIPDGRALAAPSGLAARMRT